MFPLAPLSSAAAKTVIRRSAASSLDLPSQIASTARPRRPTSALLRTPGREAVGCQSAPESKKSIPPCRRRSLSAPNPKSLPTPQSAEYPFLVHSAQTPGDLDVGNPPTPTFTVAICNGRFAPIVSKNSA